MDAKKSIERLQFFVNHLTEGEFAHMVDGKYFEAMGLTKLPFLNRLSDSIANRISGGIGDQYIRA